MASRMNTNTAVIENDIEKVNSLILHSLKQATTIPATQPESQWALPIEKFSLFDRLSHLYDFHQEHCKIDEKEFNRNAQIVTLFLQLVLKSLRQEVSIKYPCISLGDYVPQGSSKEGLKVGHADEFDAIFPIKLEGIEPQFVTHLDDQFNIAPGFTEIRTSKPKDDGIFAVYNKLQLLEKVRGDNEKFSLSSRGVHAKLFQQLIDRAINNIKAKINRMKDVCFQIECKIRPPTVNLTITVKVEKQTGDCKQPPEMETIVIDMDIVPGILMDAHPSPEATYCKRYAVCRWIQPSKAATMENKVHYDHLDILWRISNSGYERYIIEKCRGEPSAEYLCTACRILKSIKETASTTPGPPEQFCTVVKTYYIKTVLLYAILNLHMRAKLKLSGVCEALAYIIEMFRLALLDSGQCLPNFFLANFYSHYIFVHDHSPSSAFCSDYAQMNLFGEITKESLHQAALSLDNVLMKFQFKPILDIQKPDLNKKCLDMFAEQICKMSGS